MIKTLYFLKMEGIGNDFIVTHHLRPKHIPVDFIAREAIRLCDRRRGIGADGLITITGRDAGDQADCTMTLQNADGGEADEEVVAGGVKLRKVQRRHTGSDARVAP